jgi:hypothetical protein
MLQDAWARPTSAWRQLHLASVSRIFRDPRVIDERIRLPGYEGEIRQMIVTELGHEEPTFLLTNQLTRSPAKLIERYARRMIIENSIQDGIDFFHMDALSSAVPMKVDCDLQLTLMGSSLYRLFGNEIGQGYECAKSRTIFRDFIDAHATVDITDQQILVRFHKRAHNPLLLKAGFEKKQPEIPWLKNKQLRFLFG